MAYNHRKRVKELDNIKFVVVKRAGTRIRESVIAIGELESTVCLLTEFHEYLERHLISFAGIQGTS